jgi:hypothetical protein
MQITCSIVSVLTLGLLSGGLLSAAMAPVVAQAPAPANVDASALRGAACVGLVGHQRKVDPLPARGPDGAMGRIGSDGTDKVLAIMGCDATNFTVRYKNADWQVSRALLGVRWIQTGDRLDGGALITPEMRAKAVQVARAPVAAPKCDQLASVAKSENSRIFGAAGLSEGAVRCR